MSILWPLAASLLGAALLGVPAHYYRITRLECTAHFSIVQHLFACGSYLLALALLTLGWLGFLRRTAAPAQRPPARPPLSLRAVLAAGALVQLVSLVALPFLSRDPLFYAALGRAATRFGATPYTPMCASLPPDDLFLRLLSPSWRCGTSAYGSGFNRLTGLVAQWAGDDLTAQLRLYQLLGAMTLVLTAWLTGLAARGTTREREPGDRGAWAAALVLLSPLAVIEGTVSAHNDVFLALAVAGFAFLVTRRRPLLAGLVLLSGLLIKLSAGLLAGFYLLRQAIAGVRRLNRARSRRLGLALLSLGTAVTGAGLVLLLRAFWPVLATPAHGALALIGNPTTSAGYCTRSVECMPRAFLIWIAHAPTAAWLVGLGFRIGGGLLLLYTAGRAARDEGPLGWAASFFFFYYLYLHGYMQSWYFLPLLPLLFALPERLRQAALLLCVGAVAYYVLYIPFYCAFGLDTPVIVSLSEVGQAAVVIIPPTVFLLRGSRF